MIYGVWGLLGSTFCADKEENLDCILNCQQMLSNFLRVLAFVLHICGVKKNAPAPNCFFQQSNAHEHLIIELRELSPPSA